MSKSSRFTVRRLSTAGIIAAVYAGLTLLLPIPQYGGIQIRVAEAMTVLPFLFPEAIPGLAVSHPPLYWTGWWAPQRRCWPPCGLPGPGTAGWPPCRR